MMGAGRDEVTVDGDDERRRWKKVSWGSRGWFD